MSPGDKISTGGGQELGHNPFAALSGLSLPIGSPAAAKTASLAQALGSAALLVNPAKNRGRVDILREKAGRGGRTVTVATGFVGIGLPEKEQLAKKMQKACGSGGTVKDGRIEIQGDKRDEVARILAESGFKPVFAGG
jgi:translation initiation factor 1